MKKSVMYAWLSMVAAIPVCAAEPPIAAKPVSAESKWRSECGSCHVAYPARMLGGRQWKLVMAGLDKHYGTDASLSNLYAKEIETFLLKNAGSGRFDVASNGAAGKLPRITDQAWFDRAHDELPSSSWKHAAVKSKSNCAACHTTADKGNFSEHNIRMPSGLQWED